MIVETIFSPSEIIFAREQLVDLGAEITFGLRINMADAEVSRCRVTGTLKIVGDDTLPRQARPGRKNKPCQSPYVPIVASGFRLPLAN